jgi:hypothetical protein
MDNSVPRSRASNSSVSGIGPLYLLNAGDSSRDGIDLILILKAVGRLDPVLPDVKAHLSKLLPELSVLHDELRRTGLLDQERELETVRHRKDVHGTRLVGGVVFQ